MRIPVPFAWEVDSHELKDENSIPISLGVIIAFFVNFENLGE